MMLYTLSLEVAGVALAERLGVTADSLPAAATHAVRREVPVVVTGAPVEEVVVAEFENWT
jgi:hypothetical protein